MRNHLVAATSSVLLVLVLSGLGPATGATVDGTPTSPAATAAGSGTVYGGRLVTQGAPATGVTSRLRPYGYRGAALGDVYTCADEAGWWPQRTVYTQPDYGVKGNITVMSHTFGTAGICDKSVAQTIGLFIVNGTTSSFLEVGILNTSNGAGGNGPRYVFVEACDYTGSYDSCVLPQTKFTNLTVPAEGSTPGFKIVNIAGTNNFTVWWDPANNGSWTQITEVDGLPNSHGISEGESSSHDASTLTDYHFGLQYKTSPSSGWTDWGGIGDCTYHDNGRSSGNYIHHNIVNSFRVNQAAPSNCP